MQNTLNTGLTDRQQRELDYHREHAKEHQRILAALEEITKHLQPCQFEKQFNFLVTRIVPDRFEFIAKADRLLLRLLKPIGRLLAERLLFSAHVST